MMPEQNDRRFLIDTGQKNILNRCIIQASDNLLNRQKARGCGYFVNSG